MPGPVFANMILADEINRTPPKTQAALLEAMQEHQVTAAGVRHALPEPFFVLATQNPIEMEGTYPLPEAQLDRFMFNVVIDYLPEDEEVRAREVARARGARVEAGGDPDLGQDATDEEAGLGLRGQHVRRHGYTASRARRALSRVLLRRGLLITCVLLRPP